MEQDSDQMGKDDEQTSIEDTSSLNFNFLDEDRTETVAGTNEPAEGETFTVETPSAFMNTAHILPESSSPGKIETLITKKLLLESPRRRKKKARPEYLSWNHVGRKGGGVHHLDHENKTGCGMDRAAFIHYAGGLDGSTVLRAQFMLKTGLNGPLQHS